MAAGPHRGEDIRELLRSAWQARLDHHPGTIGFDHPNNTEVVSTTGTACALDCAHCGKHYLEHMTPVSCLAQDNYRPGEKTTSWLISGGCDRHGKVPLLQHREVLEGIRGLGKLNFHVGLVDEEEARELGGLADVISFDIAGDNDTIKEVYGLSATVDNYFESYRLLRKHARVLPHIAIGLRGGQISGEYTALERLKAEGVDGLVFLICIPTRGTRYEDRMPPAPVEALEVVVQARLMFPDVPIFMGCMRPGGRYRQQFDLLALAAGVNRIVNPAPICIRAADDLGLTVERGSECCVL